MSQTGKNGPNEKSSELIVEIGYSSREIILISITILPTLSFYLNLFLLFYTAVILNIMYLIYVVLQ